MTIAQLMNRLRNKKADADDTRYAIEACMEHYDMTEDDATRMVESMGDRKVDSVVYNEVVEALRQAESDEDAEGDEEADNGDDETNDETEGQDGEAEEKEEEESEADADDDEDSDRNVKDILSRRVRNTRHTPQKELSYSEIDDQAGQWFQELRDGRRNGNIKGVDFKAIDQLRKDYEAEGKELTFTRAVNTLATAGANNITLKDSIVGAIVAFSFTDESKIHGLRAAVRNVNINSNSYRGDMIGKAVVVDRNQGVDVTPAQGPLSDFELTLTDKSALVEMDNSALNVQGNVIPTLRESIAFAVQENADDTIVSALNGATGMQVEKVSGTKKLSALTWKQLQTFKSKIPGGSTRVVAMSSGAYDVLLGIVGTDNRPVFPIGQRFGSAFGENSVVLTDSLPSGVEVEDATKRKVAYMGNLRRNVDYVTNTATGASGSAYLHQRHATQLYIHYSHGAVVKKPAELGYLETNSS